MGPVAAIHMEAMGLDFEPMAYHFILFKAETVGGFRIKMAVSPEKYVCEGQTSVML